MAHELASLRSEFEERGLDEFLLQGQLLLRKRCERLVRLESEGSLGPLDGPSRPGPILFAERARQALKGAFDRFAHFISHIPVNIRQRYERLPGHFGGKRLEFFTEML
jgi:hypothetical protein